MYTKITKILDGIIKSEGINPVFVVESGSRAWGMESKDSDYDIRFVYSRPILDYMKITTKPDVISKMFDSKGKPTEDREEVLFDVVGFDIRKFSRMLYVSNPSVIQWIQSPCLYQGSIPSEWIEIAKLRYNPQALFYHNLSMSKKNYMRYVHSNEMVTQKKYLYACRGVLNAMWVLRYGMLPPINLEECIKGSDITDEIKDAILTLISNKKQGLEQETCDRIPLLDTFIETHIHGPDVHIPKRNYAKKAELLNDVIKMIVLDNNG